MDCKWDKSCDGADCMYDYFHSEPEDYDEKKLYKVILGMAYTDEIYSKRDVAEYYSRHPHDDTSDFMEKEKIEASPDIHWDNDDYWLMIGKRDAEKIIREKGLETVYGWWQNKERTIFQLKREIGFFDELMRQAEIAGLRVTEERKGEKNENKRQIL